VGESSSQVRAAYTGAWGEVIRDEDRPTVRAISLQRWAGQFWSGQWEHQMYLAVPAARGTKGGTGEVVDPDAELEVDAELEAEAEAEPDADADPDAEVEVEEDAEIEADELDEDGDSATPGKSKKK
jgi:hypothetical protein